MRALKDIWMWMGESLSNEAEAPFLYSSKEKKSVASSMKRKPENPKEDIYGVARQNILNSQWIAWLLLLTAVILALLAWFCRWLCTYPTLTTCVNPGSQTWLKARTTWGVLKNINAWNPPLRLLFNWAGVWLDHGGVLKAPKWLYICAVKVEQHRWSLWATVSLFVKWWLCRKQLPFRIIVIIKYDNSGKAYSKMSGMCGKLSKICELLFSPWGALGQEPSR